MSGAVVGVDGLLFNCLSTGVKLGYAETHARFFESSNSVDSYDLALYSTYCGSCLKVSGTLGFGRLVSKTRRTLVIGADHRVARSRYYGDRITALGQAQVCKALCSFNFEGVASLQYVRLNQHSFSEEGGGSMALFGRIKSMESLRPELLLRVNRHLPLFTPELRLGVEGELLDDKATLNAAFASSPTLGFTSLGVRIPRLALIAGASLRLCLDERLSLFLDYDLRASHRFVEQTVTGGARILF